MAPPHQTPHPPAAQPTRNIFDPWNSSSTGHQRAENRLGGSTSWRVSRTAKLASQFKSGGTGGKRMYDTVGAGSENFGKEGRKEKGWQDLGTLLAGGGGAGKREDDVPQPNPKRRKVSDGDELETKTKEDEVECEAANEVSGGGKGEEKKKKKIFDGLCVFINGSTAPMVGDHRLKQLLAENGARVSIALGRRTVTHVVLGTPNGIVKGDGAGGGLAASKIQKEIQRVGGKGVKYVGVQWVLESLKAGMRLPEAQFSTLTLAAKGQKSVYGMFPKEKPTSANTPLVNAASKVAAA